ncbi:MAG: ASCH domain-containing protein [Coprobacillaceae bacterium]
MENIEAFWNRYLKYNNKTKNTKYIDVFHFDLTEYWANTLLELVLEGKKRATASTVDSWKAEGDPLPKIGNLSIITNWDGIPKCVIETTNLTILPFKDMTYDICKREGEDETLESWRKGHINYFTQDAKNLNYIFTEDSLVLFEDFEVVYQE